MHDLLHGWRFYSLRREDYMKCMRREFSRNLYSLWFSGTAFAILLFVYSSITVALAVFKGFPRPKESVTVNIAVYGGFLAISIVLDFFTRYQYNQHRKGKHVGDMLIYTLIILKYATIIMFGVYIGVWGNYDSMAVIFMSFLICALFLIIAPPIFNLSLTLGAMAIFIVSTVSVKDYTIWLIDIMNVSVAGLISIVFTWCINMYRMSASLNASKLEKERDKYHDQSMVDELTRLRNRRDFTQVFQRYLTNYRDVDKFLCLGIIDVDHFKRYNDRYGHPKGDECLRLLAGALIALQDNMGVYAARIGGEEFALLWFEEDRHRVSTVVSYLQRRIRELNISHENSITAKRLTISLGVFVAPCGVYDTTQAIYNLADSVLYEAKGKGRNCAVILNGDEKQHIPG